MKAHVLVLLFFFYGCGSGEIPVIDTEVRFQIGIGTMEDELDLFLKDGLVAVSDINFILNDGLFYISNGKRGKILEFTSYGDLLQMIFHPDLNPQPVMLKVFTGNNEVINRRAIPFQFHSMGRFMVSPTKDIYIEEIFPSDRVVTAEDGTLLRSVILRFNRQGDYLDYVGQDGVAGTPFPYIDQILVNEKSDLIVISKTVDFLMYNYFSRSGEVGASGKISLSALPVPSDFQGRVVFPVLESVWADWSRELLYFHISYIENLQDEESRSNIGVNSVGSRVFTLDTSSRRFSESFSVPPVVISVGEGTAKKDLDRPLEFLGVTKGRDFCFLSMERPGRFRLFFTDNKGEIIEQRSLDVAYQDLKVAKFSLSSNGTLGAIFSDGTDVKAVWWRTDRILGLFHTAPGL